MGKSREALASVRSIALTLVLAGTTAAHAAPVRLSILHTNDLHSHFRPEGGVPGLGGVARLKTLIDRVRAENPSTFLVDGGDFSEGHVYYNLGAGTETIRLMDRMGYDVTVVGNHDWLNGPDVLLDAYRAASPRMELVGANLNLETYERAREFRSAVKPYVVRRTGDTCVAFMGLVTYEFVYDKFLRPVSVTEPFAVSDDLSRMLKKRCPVVVAISHNQTAMNRQILKAAPAIDLVIGAHDHDLLTEPVVVERRGAKPGWVVEVGSWGRYLGRVDVTVDGSAVSLDRYRLYQADSSVPENAEIAAHVDRLDAELETRYGPIFHDHVGHSEIDLDRGGLENRMGNLVADAYLAHSRADAALDNTAFIYGRLHEGEIRTADVYNALPAVWNPRTDRSWTLKLLPITGRRLRWVFNLLFATQAGAQAGAVSAAGLQVVFDPLLAARAFASPFAGEGRQDLAPGLLGPGASIEEPILLSPEILEADDASGTIIKSISVGGRSLDKATTYTIAVGGGVLEALEFLNTVVPGFIPLDDLRETGVEDWRIVRDHVARLGTITARNVTAGDRIRTIQPDLSVRATDVSWTLLRAGGDSASARITAVVRNDGLTASPATPGRVLRLVGNRNRADTSRTPDPIELGEPRAIPALAPGASFTASWDAIVPGERGAFPVVVEAAGTAGEANHANDRALRWFKAPSGVKGGPARAGRVSRATPSAGAGADRYSSDGPAR